MIATASTELRKFVAPEFVYGDGALALVGRYAKNFGARKTLLVTDPGLIRAGWVGRTLDSLEGEGVTSVVFDGVTPDPTDDEVEAGVRFYEEHCCDVIVAVGGGSPMDCAKAIGVAHSNGRSVLEFEGVDEVPMPGPPLICVPTTAGSSADVSQFAIITDSARKLKIAIISKTVVPDVSLIDPMTTTTMDTELTAATGLDALTHAVEAYVSNASSPMTDLNALAAIPLIVRNLRPAIEDPEDVARRADMMLGSLLAGLAFSNASLGLVHAMAHSLGGLASVPHGMADALLLDHVVDFNYSAAPDRYDQVARAMGVVSAGPGPDARKAALLAGIAGLRESVGIRTTIGAMGVTRSDIPRLSLNALCDPCLVTNPRRPSARDIEEMYDRAL